ncbi:tumor necrosis factor receptor superfamily member 3-like isoform X2 [Heterodontus francisci]|uniref:tumor necrosis factor receptor superfamily member 3-like isoform X2 n=1 Tax=Heterodontus francisci TaxID=7792 RepID=UPI00355BD9BE
MSLLFVRQPSSFLRTNATQKIAQGPRRKMRALNERLFLFALVSHLCLPLSSTRPYVRPASGCRNPNDYHVQALGICCRKCPPGFFAEQRCTRQTDTLCKPCPPGEFTEFWNYVRECNLCQSCDLRSAQEDTMCRDCPSGTFQKLPSLEKCRKHTNCTALRLVEGVPGSPASDAVCAKAPWVPVLPVPSSTILAEPPTKGVDPPPNDVYLPIVVIVVTALCFCVLLTTLVWCIRNSKRSGGQKGNTETQQASARHSLVSQTMNDIDRTSLESKVPLLPNQQASPLAHRPAQAQARLATQGLSWTSPVNQEARASPGEGAAHSAGGPGLGGEHGARCHSQACQHPYPEPRPEEQARPGAQAGVYGAHGLVGLQGCHVCSFESKLTVNGPLYIYNGHPAPPCEEPQGSASRQDGTGGVAGGTSVPEESGRVPEEETGGTTQAVQERGSWPDSKREGPRLVTAQQEEGGESHAADGPDDWPSRLGWSARRH